MDISDWRGHIDALDRKLVELLNQRAAAVREIGRFKQAAGLPIYEPAREQAIYANIRMVNQGPLPDSKLTQIFERIIDIMRNFQIKS